MAKKAARARTVRQAARWEVFSPPEKFPEDARRFPFYNLRLVSANGEILCSSVQGYTRLRDVKRAKATIEETLSAKVLPLVGGSRRGKR